MFVAKNVSAAVDAVVTNPRGQAAPAAAHANPLSSIVRYSNLPFQYLLTGRSSSQKRLETFVTEGPGCLKTFKGTVTADNRLNWRNTDPQLDAWVAKAVWQHEWFHPGAKVLFFMGVKPMYGLWAEGIRSAKQAAGSSSSSSSSAKGSGNRMSVSNHSSLVIDEYDSDYDDSSGSEDGGFAFVDDTSGDEDDDSGDDDNDNFGGGGLSLIHI